MRASLSFFLATAAAALPTNGMAQGLTVDINEAVRKYVRDEIRYQEHRKERAARYDLDGEGMRVASPCFVYERAARRALFSYTDQTTSLGVRPLKGGLGVEWRVSIDATKDMLANYNLHCRDFSPWQGYGMIIYRSIVGAEGNQSGQDIVRDLDAERLQRERQRGGITVPSTAVIKLPKPEDYKISK